MTGWVQIIVMLIAAMCFAAGGLFMKLSQGITRPAPTMAFLALFAVGALLQALAMRRSDLGVVYIAVLGLEAALASLFSAAVFHENWPAGRILAVLLIVAGVVLLRQS